MDPSRIGALLLDEAAAHPVAERDDAVRAAEEIPVDAIERGVDGAILKVLEQRRNLGKDVLAEKHEARARPPRGPERGKADNRRIGQRDDDVGPADTEAGRRRGREIADVIRRASHESALVAAWCRSRA